MSQPATYRFIFNPISGGPRAAAQRLAVIRRFIDEHRLAAELSPTQGPGHATELARQAVAQGTGTVVAVGGDGTLNEVAQALVRQPVDFGLVPTGSGNGFARHFGLPLALKPALAALLSGRVRAVDYGTVNGQAAFFNMLGLGFDAAVGQQFNQSRWRGPLPYFWLGLRTFLSHPSQTFQLQLDDAPARPVPAFVLCVANISQYGNNAYIAPGADAADGLLDVVALPRPRFTTLVPLVRGLFAGSLLRQPGVQHWRARRVRVSLPTGALAHTDGEVHPLGPELLAECHPGALRLRVPAG
jgi:diacylglycerol kinase (ATP)